MPNHKQHSVRRQDFSSDTLTAPSQALRMQPAELFQDEAADCVWVFDRCDLWTDLDDSPFSLCLLWNNAD